MYGKLQNVSSKLIKQFGVPCTVRTERAGRYDPATGESSRSRSQQSAYCLFDNLAYDFSSVQRADMVQQGDVLIYITAEGKPTINSMVIVEGGEKWAVINCQPIRPAGVVMLYQCQARKVE